MAYLKTFVNIILHTARKTLRTDLRTITNNNRYAYEIYVQIAEFLKSKTKITPTVGLICGSGLGPLAEVLQDEVEIPYKEIPNFPKSSSTIHGHSGILVIGLLDGIPTVVMKGRFHFYEGYPLWKCTIPVRVMKLLGVTHLIVTNASGGLNEKYNTGDIMLIKDHINFLGFGGHNPLMVPNGPRFQDCHTLLFLSQRKCMACDKGPNEDKFGPRFPAVNNVYDQELLKTAHHIAKQMDIESIVHEGVYACVGGPNYETIAEGFALKSLGADTVGMSTAHEVLVAAHCGIKVLGFSLVASKGIVSYETKEEPQHDEVIDVAKSKVKVLQTFVRKVVKSIKVGKESTC